MKIRYDYVTNSSSSSFVISKSDIDKRKLKKILVEIANKMEEELWEEPEREEYTEEDFNDGRIGDLYIRNCTRIHPYEDPDGFVYDNHWYIHNNMGIRYEWSVVEDVLDKYGLNFVMGYCD